MQFVSYLLTPATVCLAVPLYMQFEQLKRHWKAIAADIATVILASMFSALIG